ncbi:N-acetylmuramoyl-L-alanine amidase family protein [Streptococcus pseudopneumoniae]|uniref:N-acetylmuramoyl-L-alanine amidase family protein n=1 Tax=Streptococcus pseudopneumoniae TaxID=257758 RepID=UPI00110C2D30|nr:N-acetylmuramoyl-L-alanine amidase family protein [Streptococcus pseudopneumoniae]TMR87322.1 N-acetylmuramoyl-L-alanine amidase family protein [Streptococcus pseudopneumoniae]
MKKIVLTTTAVLSLLATGATISSVNAASGPAPQTNSQSDSIIATDVTLIEKREAKIQRAVDDLSKQAISIQLVDENYSSNFKNQFPNFFEKRPEGQVYVDGKQVTFKATNFGIYSMNFESKGGRYKATVDVRENVGKGLAFYIYLTKLEVLSTNQTSGKTTTTTPASSPTTPTPTKTDRWVQAGSRWWFKHSDGSYTSNGWEKINGVWYRFDNSGWMQTGWVKDGNWYYLDGSGAMKTGWLKDNGSWYYLQDSGAMKTGWMKVSGKWYYAYSSGALAINTTTPDGYRVNYNGEWVE